MKAIAQSVIHKVISANDLGLTGSHQAGIHIPKQIARSGFLPTLDERTLNPREELELQLPSGRRFAATFIFYNNRQFGGTRNEFRLTHLTRALREIDAYAGGTLRITRLTSGIYDLSMLDAATRPDYDGRQVGQVLRLSGGWVLINI